MKNFKLRISSKTGIDLPDPFDDPVAFLASFGIEAELVHVEVDILESAA